MASSDPLLAVFNMYDKNHDDEITPDEIKSAMLSYLKSEEKAEAEKNRILSKCDLDRNGKVTFGEFKRALTREITKH